MHSARKADRIESKVKVLKIKAGEIKTFQDPGQVIKRRLLIPTQSQLLLNHYILPETHSIFDLHPLAED